MKIVVFVAIYLGICFMPKCMLAQTVRTWIPVGQQFQTFHVPAGTTIRYGFTYNNQWTYRTFKQDTAFRTTSLDAALPNPLGHKAELQVLERAASYQVAADNLLFTIPAVK